MTGVWRLWSWLTLLRDLPILGRLIRNVLCIIGASGIDGKLGRSDNPWHQDQAHGDLASRFRRSSGEIRAEEEEFTLNNPRVPLARPSTAPYVAPARKYL